MGFIGKVMQRAHKVYSSGFIGPTYRICGWRVLCVAQGPVRVLCGGPWQVLRGVASCVRPVGSRLRFTIPVKYNSKDTKATALSNLGGMFRIVGPGDATRQEGAVILPTLHPISSNSAPVSPQE